MPRQAKTPSGALALRLYRRRWPKIRSREQLIDLLQDLADRLFRADDTPVVWSTHRPDGVVVYLSLRRRTSPVLGYLYPTAFNPFQGEMCVRALFRLAATEELNR